jgi:hypothetical protein
MESGTALLGLDGTFGYKHLSELRAKQLCNFTDAQWTSANFAPLKHCLQNMTFQRFIDLEYVSGKNILGIGNIENAFFRPSNWRKYELIDDYYYSYYFA